MRTRLIVGVLLALAVASSVPAAEAWRPLFNGKDLRGWKHVGPGEMVVEDGLIRTRGGMGLHDHHLTGARYSLTKALARPGKPGPEWNTLEITLEGPRTVVSLNGVKVTDYTEGQAVPPRKWDFEPQRGPRPDAGCIGLQNHSEHDVVFFKEVAVRLLKR